MSREEDVNKKRKRVACLLNAAVFISITDMARTVQTGIRVCACRVTTQHGNMPTVARKQVVLSVSN